MLTLGPSFGCGMLCAFPTALPFGLHALFPWELTLTCSHNQCGRLPWQTMSLRLPDNGLGVNPTYLPTLTRPAPPPRLGPWRRVTMAPLPYRPICHRVSHINVLRQAQFSMKSIAAGIQCWVAYCSHTDQSRFRPTSSRVCARCTFFQPGGSFAQYVARLAKSR